MTLIRPGPERIKPGAAPGGLVVHVYDTRDGALVTFGPLDLDADLDAICADHVGQLGRLLPPSTPVCLVFYDGDTGDRMAPPPPWASGQRLT